MPCRWTIGSKRRTTGADELLTQEELKDRLTLSSVALVAELGTVTQQQLQAEAARHGRLDSKATSLLTAAGLSLTVVSAFSVTTVPSVPGCTPCWLLQAAIASGIAAALLAVGALLVRQSSAGANERTVFDVALLETAEGAQDEDQGVREYRKAMICHEWSIVQTRRENNERRGRIIQIGQCFFAVFLVSVCALAMSRVSSSAVSEPPAKPPGESTSPPSPAKPAPARPLDTAAPVKQREIRKDGGINTERPTPSKPAPKR